MGSQEYRKMFFYIKKAYLICNQICANLLSLNEKINPKKKKTLVTLKSLHHITNRDFVVELRHLCLGPFHHD